MSKIIKNRSHLNKNVILKTPFDTKAQCVTIFKLTQNNKIERFRKLIDLRTETGKGTLTTISWPSSLILIISLCDPDLKTIQWYGIFSAHWQMLLVCAKRVSRKAKQAKWSTRTIVFFTCMQRANSNLKQVYCEYFAWTDLVQAVFRQTSQHLKAKLCCYHILIAFSQIFSLVKLKTFVTTENIFSTVHLKPKQL